MPSRGVDVVVGVDIGTTNAKAVAYDAEGHAHAAAQREYALASPRPGYAEQDPDAVVDAVLEALAEAVAAATGAGHRVAAVSWSAAMHTLIGLGGDGRPVTPSITWADTRATAQATRLRDHPDGMAVYRRTGTPLHPMAPLSKLVWFREEDPERFAAARRWVGVKEYAFRRLFGAEVVDASLASATGLYALAADDWDAEALGIAGIDRGQLSRLVPAGHVERGLERGVADRLGLDPATPFVVGASDGTLANLGVGAITPGVAAATVGTSGAVRLVVDAPRVDERMRTFCYALTPGRWVVGGAISNGGLVLRWLRDVLFADVADDAEREGAEPYERLVALAADVPPGSDGLLCLPYLTGERAPRWSGLPSGVLFGVRREHSRGHVVRAVLESVMLQLRTVVAALDDAGTPPTSFRATGGFAASPLWRQIMADVFGRDIGLAEAYEGTCLGAALVGMDAVDLVDDVAVAADLVAITDTVTPDLEAAAVYDRVLPLYERLVEDLWGSFADLAALRGDLPTGADAD